MRTDIIEKRAEILKWIEENQSKAYMCQQLQCKQDTLNAYLKKMGIEYAGNQGGKGIKVSKQYLPAEKYIKVPSMKLCILREKLIREGLKEDKCELCGLSEWQGTKITLELHHKDGNHYHNTLDNIQLLCPNCHSIQEVHKKSRDIYNK